MGRGGSKSRLGRLGDLHLVDQSCGADELNEASAQVCPAGARRGWIVEGDAKAFSHPGALTVGAEADDSTEAGAQGQRETEGQKTQDTH